jgi:hypothetical protein
MSEIESNKSEISKNLKEKLEYSNIAENKENEIKEEENKTYNDEEANNNYNDYKRNNYNENKNGDDYMKNINLNDDINNSQNKINNIKLNNSKENNNIYEYNSNNSKNFNNYPENQRKNSGKYSNNHHNISNKNNDAYLYLKQLSISKLCLQVIYSELNLSHRFIRFSISNTNKYYKYDFKTLKNMIMKYLSFDRGNINFRFQDDREVFKDDQKSTDPIIDNLLKEMINNGLFNSENKNKITFTIAIVYDYSRNENNKQIFKEFKENYNGKNISYNNFKLINENQILNEPKSLEGILSRWTIDFFEQFKELFYYYEDDIKEENYGYDKPKINRPKFLEIRPKIFK